jgi:hypothetical protein
MCDGVKFPEDSVVTSIHVGQYNDSEHVQLNEFMIPKHTFNGIKSYVETRVPPGDFLRAVLENDLSEAVARADVHNRAALADIVCVVYNYAPSCCWGDAATVKKWLKKEEEG